MSSRDKYQLMQALVAKGWEEVGDGYQLKPPQRLIDELAKRAAFHVYEAKDLEDLLGAPADSADGSHCGCNDPSQCWEPCGTLGKTDEHARQVPSERS